MLLTALMLAADRVDSTAGLQMAYLKQWAPRAHNDSRCACPICSPAREPRVRGDALKLVDVLRKVRSRLPRPALQPAPLLHELPRLGDAGRWDAPAHYGVACKRLDARDDETSSPFNSKRAMPKALESAITRTRAEVVVVSYNDESWVAPGDISRWLYDAGHAEVAMLAFDSKRYVGAQIGIFDPAGQRVGQVSHLRNTEYVFVAGPADLVRDAVGSARTNP